MPQMLYPGFATVIVERVIFTIMTNTITIAERIWISQVPSAITVFISLQEVFDGQTCTYFMQIHMITIQMVRQSTIMIVNRPRPRLS